MKRVDMVLLAVGVVFGILPAAKAEPGAAIGEGEQPQVAVDPAGNVFVVWASGTTVQVAASTDGGKTFAAPVTVGDVPGLPLGMRRGPRIAATKDAVVVTAISGPQGRGKDGDLYAWVSADQGKTWTKTEKPINSVASAPREGLHGMAAGPNGELACAWLDLRNIKPGKPGTEIWLATSADGGKTWSKDAVVYRNPEGTVCECCHPSVVIGEKGAITVLFRNAASGSRDMYLTTSTDGGKTFGAAGKLGTGTWKLNACPMDGGGLVRQGAGVATIWQRQNTVFLDSPGQAEQQLAAKARQPAIAAASDGTYAAWMTGDGVFALAPGNAAELLAAKGEYPAIAGAPDGKGPVVAVWEQQGSIGAKTVRERK